MNTTTQTPTITDHTAVNWAGDPASLTLPEVLARMNSLANYAAARLRPYSEWDASSIDQSEANRALDMWADCRSAVSGLTSRWAQGA